MSASRGGAVVGLGLAFAALVSGCGGGGRSGRAVVAPGVSPVTSGTPTPGPAFGSSTWPHPVALRELEQGRFATSPLCLGCHSNAPTATAMRDSAGRGVAPYDLWQASMMANAARDPLWRAEVSVELAATPAARGAIEAKCLSCHSPMATHDARSRGETLTMGVLAQDTPQAHLALDGVSCTFCHAVVPDVANPSTSFNGNQTLAANKDLFGPYDNPVGTPMFLRTAYLPVKADHLRESALCASCHTLFTTSVGPDGAPTGGVLPEQTAFLEWQNSIFDDTRATPTASAASCQGCHVPTTDASGQAISTRIARGNGGADMTNLVARSPYGRHLFVGGNTLIPAIIRDRRGDLNPLAPDAAFDEVIAATRDQLRNRTASAAVLAPARAGDQLTIPVRVTNLTGHKLPTGHPTRRLWLRVRVRDASGALVFASGEHDAAGRLVDRAGQVLPEEVALGPTHPHRDVVASDREVQVWESLMRDRAGAATFLLLRGEGYLKDDRLLPQGWVATHPTAADTLPRGVAGDADFGAGGDVVSYRVLAPAANGPYTVEATVLYQVLSARFADELFRWRTPEVEAFRAYYESADRTPEVVATAGATVN